MHTTTSIATPPTAERDLGARILEALDGGGGRGVPVAELRAHLRIRSARLRRELRSLIAADVVRAAIETGDAGHCGAARVVLRRADQAPAC